MTIDQIVKDILLALYNDFSGLSENIVALNIGIQELEGGVFELYLDGYDWYGTRMENDIWLLDEKWAPFVNYISISNSDFPIERSALVATVERIFVDTLRSHPDLIPKQIQYVGLTAGGMPILLYSALT